jgi:hypothetical protein
MSYRAESKTGQKQGNHTIPVFGTEPEPNPEPGFFCRTELEPGPKMPEPEPNPNPSLRTGTEPKEPNPGSLGF